MGYRDYQAFLILAVFIASGVSFFPGKFSRIFVRIVVAAVGIVGCLAVTGGIMFAIGFSAGFGARSFGPDAPRMLGSALIAIYFALGALTCLPIIPVRHLRVCGLVLHFAFLPIATCLASQNQMINSFDQWFGGFASMLSLGLIYAMLWFRMLALQESPQV